MSSNLLYVLYIMFFSGSIILSEYKTLFFVLISITNIVALLTRSQNRNTVIFSATIMGSETFSIINIIMAIIIGQIRKPLEICSKIKKRTLLLMIWFSAVSLLSGVYYSTVFNSIFYFSYLILLWITYKYIRVDMDCYEIKSILKKFLLLQAIITVEIVIKYHSFIPGDIFGGTIMNAHFFSNWLILTCFVYIYVLKKMRRISIIDIGYLISTIIMLILASANAVVIAAVLAIMIYSVLKYKRLSDKNDLFWMICFTYLFFAIFLRVLQVPQIKNIIQNKSTYLNLYLYSKGWNYKFQYFYGTLFDSLKGIRLFTGYGLGQYGSRVANAFAYDVMWRASNGINNFIASVFPSSYVPQFARYISFYTEDFVNSILWRSAVMSYPFSSFMALLAETGVIGVILVARWLNGKFKHMECKIIIYYFLIVCIFDIFFDDYQCVLPLIFFLSMLNRKNNKVNRETKQKNTL